MPVLCLSGCGITVSLSRGGRVGKGSGGEERGKPSGS